ncbi:glycosyltransferase family 4 protein [Gelidibacter sp. F2691]|nr:glycosyltransferase family 4 protein [Gelidibacter sp. F2691]
MNRAVTFIQRNPQLKFQSIEGLFGTIMGEISKSSKTHLLYTKYSGGGPLTIIKNLLVFKIPKDNIVHITGDVHYMAFVTGKRTILTIHDIGSALKGSPLKQLYIKLFWFWLPVLFVKRITVISEFTKNELERMIPFAKRKIRVVQNPVGERFCHKEYVFNEINPTILCVGTKANKNLERIFEASVNLNCQLHIIGSLTPDQVNLLQSLNINYKNSLNIPLSGIIEAYEECDLLCFPSTYEGFGMPIIEAQAIGRPVLTSNIGAMLEVANDSACLINPFESSEIEKGIKMIISDKKYRNELIVKGLENVKRFQVPAIAKQYISIYKELM